MFIYNNARFIFHFFVSDILTIVRYDINHGDLDTFLPMKATTYLMCKKIYIDMVKDEKHYSLA